MRLATSVALLVAAVLAVPKPSAKSYTSPTIYSANHIRADNIAPALPVEVVVDDAFDLTLALAPAEARSDAVPTGQPNAPAEAVGPYPRLDAILDGAARAWPEQPGKAQRVAVCELGADVATGAYPAAVVFDLSAVHGGPMQIARAVWLPYFAPLTWPQLVQDLETHFAAARAIYDLAGGWSPWPVCGLR